MAAPHTKHTDAAESMSSAVVLLSGGLDSATTLAIARQGGFAAHCIAFDYGQRHRFELRSAARVADAIGAASYRVFPIDLRMFGASALTADIDVPKDQLQGDTNQSQSDIPITYVPARNLIFLSLAMGLAESIGARDIFIGVNAVDYSGYPDCRPAFISSFARTASLATRIGIESENAASAITIHAPLIELTKPEIIKRGISLGVDYAMTHSCYDPDDAGRACGHCDSCILRSRGFSAAGVDDPTRYIE